jgi:hypothetical protein
MARQFPQLHIPHWPSVTLPEKESSLELTCVQILLFFFKIYFWEGVAPDHCFWRMQNSMHDANRTVDSVEF